MSCPYSMPVLYSVHTRPVDRADDWPGDQGVPPAGRVVDLDEAREFLETFHRETQPGADLEVRWAQIKAEVAETGLYEQTFAELQFGARVAWRQSARCIGRARWQSLVIRDARRVRGGDAVARELADHLRFATNGGRIRSTITIFAPDDALGAPVRIRNDQLIRYA